MDLKELYQEVILDHNKSPRNFGKIVKANLKAEGYNPLCGDNLVVYLHLNDADMIEDVSFEGSGCAISKASSSMMTSSLKGKTKEEALQLFEKFHQMVTGNTKVEENETLGKLAVFSGVCEYPSRVKCASLAWHTLIAALNGKSEKVSTE